MEDITEFLRSIGLGKNETEVYLNLVKRGLSSVLEISKETKIHRSNVYEALENLLKKSLIFKITKDKKSLFYARPPRSLLDYLKNRELELNSVIEKLEAQHIKVNEESQVKLSQGKFALREALMSLIHLEKPISVYGIPQKAPDVIGPILSTFHNKRIERKIPMRHIYNKGTENEEDRIKALNQMPCTEARHLPMKYDSPVSTNICGNKVILFIWQNSSDVIVIEIENEEVAKSYQNYFELLWKMAKKE
jgi:sugar-specific transcriptional regulator TrmB